MSELVPPFGEIRNPAGQRLDYVVDGASHLEPGGWVVVIGHGVTANKDRQWAQALGRSLAEVGLPALRFSFAGNGASEGDFRACTISQEVADLGAVIEALAGQRLAYVGHSMGGAVGVIRAAQDARIELLVSLAGMVHTHDFAQRKFGQLTPGQDVMWDKPECPLSVEFLADMQAIGSTLPLASLIQVPWLLVHGQTDTVVPVSESRQLQAPGRADLVELPDADHLFSGDSEAIMTSTVRDWLQQHIPGE